ncbi:MAG: VaFE repeat-containing surface-anchored protein [Lachnospiraceae bacterium]
MNRKNIRKIVAIALLMAMALITVFFFSVEGVKAAAPEITESYVGYYDQYHNGELRMHYQAKMHKVDGQRAYCVSMTKSSEPGEAKEVNIKKYLPGDELVMACLAQKHIFDMDNYTTAEKYMLTQCMIWYIQREHIGDGGWRQYVCDIDMSVDEQKKFYSDLEKRIKEEAPSYEGQGTAWQNIEIEDVQEVAILLAPVLKTGELTVRKSSDMPELINNNQCYTLLGAQYGVYSDSSCTSLVNTLTTDKDGNTEKITIEAGKYYLKEIKASKGYLLDDTVYNVEVGYGENKVLDVKEKPGYAETSLILDKVDKETGIASAQGEASLEGAEFTVCYYDDYFDEDKVPEYDSYQSLAKRKWVIKAIKLEKDGQVTYCADMQNSECKVGGDEYYKVKDKVVLPLGTVTIQETKAPEGYTLQDSYIENVMTKEKKTGCVVTQIIQKAEGKTAEFQVGNKYKAANQVVRGDLSLRKVDGESDKAMAGIMFRLTSKTTGETHCFVTDENGEYSTSSDFIRHSTNTNGEKQGDGIWFGMMADGSDMEPDDNLGALPYDTYELCEIRGEGNACTSMYKDTVTIRKNHVVVELNNIENYKISIYTTAKGKETGTHEIAPNNSVTVIDTVKCMYLTKNMKYRLSGTIIDKNTKEVLKDENGKPIIAEKLFVAQSTGEKIDVEFEFDASKMEGKDLVVFEELYELSDDGESEVLVAQHKEIDDKGQTIHVQKVLRVSEPKKGTPKKNIVKTGDISKPGTLAAFMITAFAVAVLAVRKRYF